MMNLIVYGPQGSGKTKNAKRIAQYFKMSKIIDEASPADLKKYYNKNALFVVNENPRANLDKRRKYTIMSISSILKLIP